MLTHINTQRSAPHYSDAVVARGRTLVFVAGQVSVADDGSVVTGDIETQTRQVIANLSDVLARAGGGLHDVVSTTVYLTDRSHAEPAARVRREAFGHPGPASTLLYISGLARPEFLIEIEAVAAIADT
jgi:2-iminobutanoate/2-iminopropanoate deaminase